VNFTLIALVFIHSAAAVKQRFVDRDVVLIHAAAILEPPRFSERSLVKDSR
jgi:cytochrome b561